VTSGTAVGPTARFGRLERRGLLLGLSTCQVTLLGVALAILIATVYAAGPVGLVASSLLWAPLLVVALVRFQQRPLIEWVPIVTRFRIRALLGQNLVLRRPFDRGSAADLALPAGGRLRIRPMTGSRAVLIDDVAARSHVAIARVVGTPLALADAADQAGRVSAWGRVLASLTTAAGIGGVQVLQRAIPDGAADLVRFWSAHGVEAGSWAARVVADLAADAACPTTQECYLAIGFRARGNSDQLARQLDAVESSLDAAGLTVADWLGVQGVTRLVRTAFDPAAAATLDPDLTMPIGTAGPMGVAEDWDRLRVDGCWHAVYWVQEWPRHEVPAGFLQPLVFADLPHTLSLVARPQPMPAALREIRRAKADHHADQAQRHRLGQVTDEAMLLEADDVLQRERDLAAGHGILDFAGLLTVSACDEQELAAARTRIELAAAQAGCELRLLVGQQAQAFLAAALPLCRGLQ
jgi:hypothetical protein